MSTFGLVDFASGAAGGIAQVIVGHPFDTVKVRLQVQSAAGQSYSGAIDCVRKTIQHDGPSGLYRGATLPLLAVGVCNAVLFWSNELFRRLLASSSLATPSVPSRLSVDRIMLAGSLAGSVMAFVNCPVELVKIRMQTHHSSDRRRLTFRECFHQIAAASRGWRGFYRGITPTLLRDVPTYAAYFGSYETLKRSLHTTIATPASTSKSSNRSVLTLLLSGGTAGIVAWLVCYPQDVIKSRMQSSPSSPSNAPSTTTIQCARHIWQTVGWRGFVAGLAPTLVRAFPANAATFVAYELAQSMLAASRPPSLLVSTNAVVHHHHHHHRRHNNEES